MRREKRTKRRGERTRGGEKKREERREERRRQEERREDKRRGYFGPGRLRTQLRFLGAGKNSLVPLRLFCPPHFAKAILKRIRF